MGSPLSSVASVGEAGKIPQMTVLNAVSCDHNNNNNKNSNDNNDNSKTTTATTTRPHCGIQ
jgi:hypothetical protein